MASSVPAASSVSRSTSSDSESDASTIRPIPSRHINSRAASMSSIGAVLGCGSTQPAPNPISGSISSAMTHDSLGLVSLSDRGSSSAGLFASMGVALGCGSTQPASMLVGRAVTTPTRPTFSADRYQNMVLDSGSVASFSSGGTGLGCGSTQPASHLVGELRCPLTPAQSFPPVVMDFNSFAKASLGGSEVLRPLDEFLEIRVPAESSRLEVSRALRFYGFELPPFFLENGVDTDVARVNQLLSSFQSIRKGGLIFASMSVDVQHELANLCGMPFKDNSPRSITAGIALFSDLFLPSLTAVATQSDSAWSELHVKGLRAHLGILGYPIPNEITRKEDLRGLIPRARALIVYQGFLIPAMRQPFHSLVLPDQAIFLQTSYGFQTALVAGIMDSDEDPIPRRRDFARVLSEFNGPSVDLGLFDRALWDSLVDSFDRRVFLSMFLGVSGVPFELTERLTSGEILPLLPSVLEQRVPIHKSATLEPTPPALRKRRRIHDLIRRQPQEDSPRREYGAVTDLTSSATTAPKCAASTVNDMSAPCGINPILAALTPTQPAAPLAIPGSSASTLPLPTSSSGSGNSWARTEMSPSFSTPRCPSSSSHTAHIIGVEQPPAVAGGYTGTHVPGRAPLYPDASVVETRFITDAASIGSEYSRSDLANLSAPCLLSLVAHCFQTSLQSVPSSLSVAGCVDLIWDRRQIRGFRYLVASSVPSVPHLGHGHTLVTWPCLARECRLVCTVNGRTMEAVYSVRPYSAEPFSPGIASRRSGDPAIFPTDGTILPGDRLVVEDTDHTRVSRSLGMTPTLPSLITSDTQATQIPQAQLSLADRLISARKASDGTRILADVWMNHHPTAVQTFSVNPVLAGAQTLSSVLFHFLITSECFIQCSLCTLVTLAKQFVDLDPNHFVNLITVTDKHSARKAATEFIRHRPETQYPGTYRVCWDQHPDRLLGALMNLFDLFSTLYMLDHAISQQLHEIAVRSSKMQRDLGQWTVSNNSYFWSTTLTQVSDVFMAAGRTYTTPAEMVVALQAVPDFVNDPATAAHLSMITMAAHKHSLSMIEDSLSSGPTDGSESPRRGRRQRKPKIFNDRHRERSRVRSHGRQEPAEDRYSPRPSSSSITSGVGSNDTIQSAQPCASYNSDTGCPRRNCTYAHLLPSTPVTAARCLRIIQSRGLQPSLALQTYMRVNPVQTTFSDGQPSPPTSSGNSRGTKKRVMRGGCDSGLYDMDDLSPISNRVGDNLAATPVGLLRKHTGTCKHPLEEAIDRAGAFLDAECPLSTQTSLADIFPDPLKALIGWRPSVAVAIAGESLYAYRDPSGQVQPTVVLLDEMGFFKRPSLNIEDASDKAGSILNGRYSPDTNAMIGALFPDPLSALFALDHDTAEGLLTVENSQGGPNNGRDAALVPQGSRTHLCFRAGYESSSEEDVDDLSTSPIGDLEGRLPGTAGFLHIPHIEARVMNRFNYSSYDHANYFLITVFSPEVNKDLRISFNNPLSAVLLMDPRLIPTAAFIDADTYLHGHYSLFVNLALAKRYEDGISALVHVDPEEAHRILTRHGTDLLSVAHLFREFVADGMPVGRDPTVLRRHPSPPGAVYHPSSVGEITRMGMACISDPPRTSETVDKQRCPTDDEMALAAVHPQATTIRAVLSSGDTLSDVVSRRRSHLWSPMAARFDYKSYHDALSYLVSTYPPDVVYDLSAVFDNPLSALLAADPCRYHPAIFEDAFALLDTMPTLPSRDGRNRVFADALTALVEIDPLTANLVVFARRAHPSLPPDSNVLPPRYLFPHLRSGSDRAFYRDRLPRPPHLAPICSRRDSTGASGRTHDADSELVRSSPPTSHHRLTRGGSTVIRRKQRATGRTLPQCLNETIRIDGEPSNGDCGLGSILATLSVLCRMYPHSFARNRCPSSPAEIRATCAALMIRDLRLSSDGTPVDHWEPFLVYDPDRSDERGQIPLQLYSELQNVSQHERRRRLAMTIAHAESNRGELPVIWFTSDVLEYILRYYMMYMFIDGPTRLISEWTRPCPDHRLTAHQTIGPICITSISAHQGVDCLYDGTWDWFQSNFLVLIVIIGDHFKTYVNPKVPSFYNTPTGILPSLHPDKSWTSDIFREFYIAGSPGIWNHRFATTSPAILVPYQLTQLGERLPYDLAHMETSFPAVLDFPSWDSRYHPFPHNRAIDLKRAHLKSHCLLPRTWVRDMDYILGQPEDFFPEPGTNPLLLYVAYVDRRRRFHRALYIMDPYYNTVAERWMFNLYDRNFDDTLPDSLALAEIQPGNMVGIRLSALGRPRASCALTPLFDEVPPQDTPAEIRDFFLLDPSIPSPTPHRAGREPPAGYSVRQAALPIRGHVCPVGWVIAPSGASQAIGSLSMIADVNAEVLRAGTTVWEYSPLSKLPLEYFGSTTYSATQLQVLSDPVSPIYTSREWFRMAFPYSISKSSMVDANCAWNVTSTDPPALQLVLTETMSSTTLLKMERTWFDDPPTTLAPAVRRDLLHRWRGQMLSTFIPGHPNFSVFLQSYLTSLAAGIPSFTALFRDAENAPADIVVTPYQLSTPDQRRKLQRKNARSNTKRLCDRDRNSGHATQPLEAGWKAIDLIISGLPSVEGEFEPGFRTRLDDIRTAYELSTDSSDSSQQIQDLLRATPPGLSSITDIVIQEDTRLYKRYGLRGLYDIRIPRSVYRGLPEHRLSAWLREKLPHDQPAVDRLLRLCKNGQEPYMIPSFVPNGGIVDGKPIENNAAYQSHRVVVEDNAAKMQAMGRAVILDAAAVSEDDLASLHVNTTFAVPKQGGLARVVTHCSFGSKHNPSYNESVDLPIHKANYPRPIPPRLRDFADTFSKMREKHPECTYLHAAVVDAKAAFQLYHLSFEKFKLMWTKLQIQRGAAWVYVLVGNMCGTFGDLGAGDTWDVPASIWTALVNMASDLWTALTYVDDMTIVAAPVLSDLPPRAREYYPEPRHTLVAPVTPLVLYPPPCPESHYAIFDAVREARDILACIFGMDSSADNKVKVFFGYLISVGWYFDLRYAYWFVVPIRAKIEKIAHFIFNIVTPSTTKVETHHMQTLAGLLCWYSAALPLGRAFVYTLFQCRESLTKGFVRVSSLVQRDLSMWRALIRVALDEPSVLGCPLDLLRSDRLPDFYTVTDACTTVGGGAWLSTSPQWVPDDNNYWLSIRWTAKEHCLIQNRLLRLIRPKIIDDWNTVYEAYNHYKIRNNDGVRHDSFTSLTINILEFATCVFLIMVCAPTLRGKVLSIGSDNTATLCWLVRNRASSGAADNLLKLLSLTCTIYNIRLVVHHVRGIHNQLSDWISRVLGIEHTDPHEFFEDINLRSPTAAFEGLRHKLSTPGRLDRRMVCRVLISLAMTASEEFTMRDFLSLMLLLRDLPVVPPSSPEVRVNRVLNAFQNLDPTVRAYETIPASIERAVVLAGFWEKSSEPPPSPTSSLSSLDRDVERSSKRRRAS